MDAAERKQKIAELRKYHEKTFEALGLPAAYFAAKHAHYIQHGDRNEKYIGFYESECSKGDDIYIEFVSMTYDSVDATRRLYVWKHNPNYQLDYYVKKEQFMIPVAELKEVLNTKLGEGKVAMVTTCLKEGITTPMFTQKEDLNITTKTFEGKGGNSVHKITWKNGVLDTYYFTSKSHTGFNLQGGDLIEVMEFLKIIK